MVGRLLRSADFERVLAVAPRSRSAHFAAHHVLAPPALLSAARAKRAEAQLSTGTAPHCPQLVDDLPTAAPAGCWLGTVVPKRHARRAVTRNLLKRQMRAVMAAQAHSLPPGMWVLRLKSAFDVRQFPSAASDALRRCARDELAVLLGRAAALRLP